MRTHHERSVMMRSIDPRVVGAQAGGDRIAVTGATHGMHCGGAGHKWHVRTILALLVVILGLTAGPGAATGSFAEPYDYGGSERAYSLLGPSGLLLHPSPSQSLAGPLHGPPVPGTKDRRTASLAATRVKDRAVRVALVRTGVLERAALRVLRRTTLLFPFHFFW